jgi:hypothetical protein
MPQAGRGDSRNDGGQTGKAMIFRDVRFVPKRKITSTLGKALSGRVLRAGWGIGLGLLALPCFASTSVVYASQKCHPSESSDSDLRRATAMVRRLPELRGFTDDNYLFDTGARERIRGRCYEAVFVFAELPTPGLDLQYVFLVHLPTKTILFLDVPTDEPITLKEWRIRNAPDKAR